MQRSYQRHLPHQVPEDAPIFLTWNLKAALPPEVIAMLRRRHERLEREPCRFSETEYERKLRHEKVIFAVADRYLGRTHRGPMWLKDPPAAKIVEDAIRFGVRDRYDLFAWCVMANHVHVLLKPRWELKDITQGLKGYTAHQINALQEQRGRTFWQDESYDHWARDDDEALRIIHYIENNPVAAELCARAEDWLWSSARFRYCWPVGQPFQADTESP